MLPGSMLYSAVTHPLGTSSFFFHGGSESSMLAVQRTVVRPALMRTLPGALPVYPRVMSTGRSSSGCRLSLLTVCSFDRDSSVSDIEVCGGLY